MSNANIPKHVAIIPDGNRRWANNLDKPPVYGHEIGFERFKELTAYAKKQGIPFLTIWAFSTENWNRSKEEVNNLMIIIKRAILEISKKSQEEKSRFIHIGRRDRLPKDILKLIERTEEETKNHKDFCLCVAIDYGGEDEILRAEEKLLASKSKDKHIVDFLDTTLAGVPSPDLIIRTSGEKRLSGFMSLQSTYSELVFEEKMFPDFTEEFFQVALDEYGRRNRRYGK